MWFQVISIQFLYEHRHIVYTVVIEHFIEGYNVILNQGGQQLFGFLERTGYWGVLVSIWETLVQWNEF